MPLFPASSLSVFPVKSVQSITDTISSSNTLENVTIPTEVDKDNSIIIGNVYAKRDRWDRFALRWNFSSGTNIQLRRQTAGVESQQFSAMIIEFQPNIIKSKQFKLAQFTTASTGDGVQKDITITSVDSDKSFIIPMGMQSTYTTSSMFPPYTTEYQFTSDTNVRAKRENTIGAQADYGFEVVEFEANF